MIPKIAIIGGGAGGICSALAAGKAAKSLDASVEVHLFERNPRLGIKILISGGGKCNITHAGSVEEVLQDGFPHIKEARFLKHAMYRFTNNDILDMLRRRGVEWYVRENGRVFPTSSRAEDVLVAFEAELREAQVVIHTKSRVESIERSDNCWLLTINDNTFEADAVILATGGTSYRKVGTTGDGIDFAARLGHMIVPLRAALAPIYLKQKPHQDLVGVAIRNAVLSVTKGNRSLAQAYGDILITHRGLSGPAALDLSREAAMHFENDLISIHANLLNRTTEEIRALLIDEQQSGSLQHVKTWLEGLLPNAFVPYVLKQADIPLDRKWNALTRSERDHLTTALTDYDFGEVSEIPIDRGEVTAGGVDLKEVDPKTMMSRLHSGLFFAGEMLDIAGEIGGYNLQAAYSTGWVAGEEAVKFVVTSPVQ